MSETDIEIAKKSLKKAIEYANTINTNYPERVSDARAVVDNLSREIADLEATLKEKNEKAETDKKNLTDDGWEMLEKFPIPPIDLAGYHKSPHWDNDGDNIY